MRPIKTIIGLTYCLCQNKPIDQKKYNDRCCNRLTLCASHHLWILHILHGLKIEGTAPYELTFTFGPSSGPEGQPFMVYSSGKKVISAAA